MKLNCRSSVSRLATVFAACAAFVTLPLLADEMGKEPLAGKKATQVTVTGEVLDMACYLDHGASGEDHAACAQKCIQGGLPVGLKGTDGKTYLLIGEHKPVNKELAPHAAKTITVQGKLVERDGFRMIENAEIVKS